MGMFVKRLYHAMYLTVTTVAWIWKRFFGLGYNLNLSINFTLCYRCEKRYTKHGLVYCQPCIDALMREEEAEWEAAGPLQFSRMDDAQEGNDQ